VGSTAGGARLAFVTSLVFMPVVLYRLIVGVLEAEVDLLRGTVAAQPAAVVTGDTSSVSSSTSRLKATAPLAEEVPPPAPIPQQMAAAGAERESAQLMKALGIMLEKASPDSIPERIIEAALNSLKADVGALLGRWARGEIGAAVATSTESLLNLFDMLGGAGQDYLRDTPLIVISARTRQIAAEYGCRRILVAREASDDAIAAVLLGLTANLSPVQFGNAT